MHILHRQITNQPISFFGPLKNWELQQNSFDPGDSLLVVEKATQNTLVLGLQIILHPDVAHRHCLHIKDDSLHALSVGLTNHKCLKGHIEGCSGKMLSYLLFTYIYSYPL